MKAQKGEYKSTKTLDVRRGGSSMHAPATLTREKDVVPIAHDTERALGPFWAGAENLHPPPTNWSSNPRWSKKLLYQLSYTGRVYSRYFNGIK